MPTKPGKYKSLMELKIIKSVHTCSRLTNITFIREGTDKIQKYPIRHMTLRNLIVKKKELQIREP